MAMSNLKGYIVFCWHGLREDFERSRLYVGLTKTFRLADKAVGLLLGTGLPALVIGLVYVYREPVLSNKRWAAIAVLSISVAFLLWLVGSIKRFYERNVNRRVWIADKLGRYPAVVEEHFSLLRSPADKEFLQAWLNGAAQEIKDSLGPDALKRFYDGADSGKPPPDTLEGQIRWMRKYAGKLNMLVRDQYIAIKPKPLTKKQKARIEQVQESARAFAAKQNKSRNR
jgi:hypothetical protein